jgi:putative oxidoreductase
MDNRVIAAARELARRSESWQWLMLLIVRLYFGYFWAETGWAKLHNLDGATERFINWGIPFPHFNAVLSAGAEFLGGVLIMLGLLTRLACLPMIFNMLVALALVVAKQWTTTDEFFESDEVLYILVFAWLAIAGPGRASLDQWLFGGARLA